MLFLSHKICHNLLQQQWKIGTNLKFCLDWSAGEQKCSSPRERNQPVLSSGLVTALDALRGTWSPAGDGAAGHSKKAHTDGVNGPGSPVRG